MPTIEVRLEKPFMHTSFWKVGTNGSLDSYLRSIDALRYGYDFDRVDARFDKDHKVIRVSSEADLQEYLALGDARGPLFVQVPEGDNWPGDIARNLEALTVHTVAVGKKVMNKFMSWVNQKKVDEDAVKREEEVLKGMVKCESFRAFGEVNQYEEVDMKKWQNVIASLEEDDLPSKVIHGLQRASWMKRLNETCFDLNYKNGKLDGAFLVRLLSMKLPNDTINVVLFHYQLRFVSTGDTPGSLTPEQALAIERFVDQAALLKWKEKLQISDADDDDVF